MTPAARKAPAKKSAATKVKEVFRRKVEEAVPLLDEKGNPESREVRVKRETKDGEVVVTFPCGQTFYFTDVKMYETMQYIEQVGREVTLALKDSNGEEFYAVLSGDQLIGAEDLAYLEDEGEQFRMPWTPLKDVLEEAIDLQ